jgi:CheY-like chemotaxis protein
MLVEDHDDTRRIMSRLLTKLEHSVVTAGSIKEALSTASNQHLDLVISDIGLPDGTGLDLMRQLLLRRPIKGIALTGYGTEADTEQTRAAGFTAHLTKPIDFKELVEVIGVVTCRTPAAPKPR